MHIVQTNRKYLWRETWIVNVNWFACNLGLYFLSRNLQPVGDTFWQGMQNDNFRLDNHGIKWHGNVNGSLLNHDVYVR